MAAQNSKRNKIIIGAILLVALLLYLLQPLFFDTGRKEIKEKASKSKNVEPQFSKEGVLYFVDAEKDTIRKVDIEIADNDVERNQGMMYRSSMPYDKAMLFIMEYERPQSFWMRNTKLSLDILYINADLEIVTIYRHTQPYSESPIPSFERAKYVVETSAGFCDKFGIVEGNKITFVRSDS